MIKKIKEIWGIKALRDKIWFMLGMLFIIRLGNSIATPGIRPEVLSGIFDRFGISGGMLDIITGGALQQMAIFALGVIPYINASIIMQLLTIAIPAMDKMAKEEDGREKINKITRYMGIILAAVEAFGLTFAFRNEGILINNSILSYMVVIFTLTAGTATLIWVGDRITEKGLGNGLSFVIFVNIISKFPQQIRQIWGTTNITAFVIIVVFLVLLLALVVYMQDGERRIPVEYAKRVTGRKVYGGGSSYIPIKVNLSGVLPVIFAVSVIQFPELIIKTFNLGGVWLRIRDALALTNPIGAAIYIFLIFFFAYFYSTIQFNPLEFSENLKKSGGVISGIRPGQSTSDYIRRVLGKITFIGAIFLALIALSPIIVGAIFKTSIAIGGTSLLIAVGVALEMLKQIEAHMISRNYQGFLK